MKKKLIALLLAVACIVLPVVGCSKDCDAHVDEDGDKVCDNCGEAIACETHTDANGDFVCDVCGAATNSNCDAHVDEDKNLACDKCGATLTGGCDPHKDDNADKFCDTCGGAIVIQTQVAAPKEETRVDMVVNTIPTDAALGTYMDTTATIVSPMTGTLVEGTLVHNDRFVYTREDDAAGLTTWTLTNLLNGQTVLQIAETEGVTLSLTFFNYYIRVTETKTVDMEEVVTDFYYWYSDTLQTAPFATQVVEAGEPRGLVFENYLNGDEMLFDMDDLGYIFDDGKLLFAGVNMNTFVDRPYFSFVDDNYGYVWRYDDYGSIAQILAYDLSKWIDCVYSYTVPSHYEDEDVFALENGTILLQAMVQLSDNAVSYDLIKYGYKYDLIYVIIDPVAKTATNTEFGYYISEMTVGESMDMFTDAALNVAMVYPIVNDFVNYNAPKKFVVDNSLKILMDFEQVVKNAASIIDMVFRPNDLMVVEVEWDEYSTVQVVYTTAGEFVCYLPEGADASYRNYVKYNGKYYSYRMEELADFTEDGYAVYDECDDYAILQKINEESVMEYFYYDGVNITKIAVAGAESVSIYNTNDTGFWVSYELEGETEYAFYDAANHKVLTADRAGFVETWYSESDAYLIYTYDGSYYLVK